MSYPTLDQAPIRLASVLDHFGAGNVGDDLMLDGFLRAMEAAAQEGAGFELAIPCPHRILAQMRRFPQVLWCRPGDGYQAALRAADALVLPGDTPFMPERWVWDKAPARVALGAGKPLLCIAVGAEAPAERQLPEAAELLQRADLTTARDATSLGVLQALAPARAERIIEGADLANIALQALFRHPGKPLAERAIPLALLWYAEGAPDHQAAAFKEFLAGRAAGEPPAFLSHEFRLPYEFVRFRRLYPRGGARGRFIRPRYYAETVAELVDVYREIGVVVASRYHAILSAAWAGCRVAALPRSLKIVGLARALDIPLMEGPLTAGTLDRAVGGAQRVPRARLEALADLAMRTSVEALRRTAVMARETRRPPRRRPRSKSGPRILVVRQDSIGDVVLTTAAIRELRRSFPHAEISLVTSVIARPLFGECPYLDHVIPYEFSRWGRLMAQSIMAADFADRVLKPLGFEMALLPRYDLDYWGGRAMIAHCGAPIRIGYGAGLTPVGRDRGEAVADPFTLTLTPDDVRHEAERNLAVVEAAGGAVVDRHLELWPSVAERRRVEPLIRSLRRDRATRLVALAPGAAGKARVWPAERFAAVAQRLAGQANLRFAIVGGTSERAAAGLIASALGSTAIDLTGRLELSETFALIEACDLLISNDSAPIHLASAAGAPVVEISPHPVVGEPNAPSSPARFGPWMTDHRVLQPRRPREGCSGECEAKEPHCILDVSTEQVALAALDLFQARA